MGYHKIHCPQCGHITDPMQIKFSISEFVQEIYDRGMERTYDDDILGSINEDEITLITEHDYLWDMTVSEIDDCRVGDGKDAMFSLHGENLIKRFGAEAINMLRRIAPPAIAEVEKANNIYDTIKKTPDINNLIEHILSSLPHERLLRCEKDIEDRFLAVFELIKLARGNAVLFKVHLRVVEEKDDNQNIIPMNIRTDDDRIICNSKRCPECGSQLSTLAGKYEEKIICFIGSPAAGKSAYLAAVIHKLKTGAAKYGIESEYQKFSPDYKAFDRDCLEPYSNGFAITKTNQDTFPQISMAFENKSIGKRYLYTFVDIPGETFIGKEGFDAADMLTNRRILKYASVVWYCVSAKQLCKGRVGLEMKSADGAIQNAEMTDLDTLGLNTMEVMNTLYGDNGARPAVALIVTKTDMIADFVISEGVFSGNPAENEALRQDYLRMICSIGGRSDSRYSYSDGEPETLGYIQDGRFKYQAFLSNSQTVENFITNYGEDTVPTFIGRVATAFKKNKIPCFAQASYGRSPIERFSVENAMRCILAKKDILSPSSYAAIVSYFGEAALAKFEAEGGNLPPISQDEIEEIKRAYSKLNPVYPFGVMSILVWTFAYTGFFGCTQPEGDRWVQIRTEGPEYEELKKRLTFEQMGNVPVGTVPPSPTPEDKKDHDKRGEGKPSWIGRIFGKKQ